MAEVALADLPPLGAELRHGRGDDRALEVVEARGRAARAGSRASRPARRRSTRARSRSASARAARRRRTCRSGSACCRRRRRGAWAAKYRACGGSAAKRRTGWPASHMLARCHTRSTSSTARTPALTAERALQLKGQPYRIHEMAPAMHVPEQWLRFRATTVPALVLGNGERIVGSRAIVHRLDELVPEPPLLPADPTPRARASSEAERWGDEVLQPVAAPARLGRLLRRARTRSRATRRARAAAAGCRAAARRAARSRASRAGATEAATSRPREDLAALPGMLDQVDAWIAEGVIGGERAERRRPADRAEHPPAGDVRRRPAAARRPALPARSRCGCSRRSPGDCPRARSAGWAA